MIRYRHSKFFSSFLLLLIALAQTSMLSSCAGLGDWEYTNLPGNYEIWRTSAHRIALVYRNGEYTADSVVDSYVSEIAWNETFILAKQKPEEDSPDSDISFYAISVSSSDMYGPLTQTEFNDLIKSMRIALDDTDWTSTKVLKSK